MGIRGRSRLFAAFLLLVFLPCAAFATSDYYGQVVCESPETENAPFGGTVSDLLVRKGDLIREGDPVCTIETKKVYAPLSGTVSGVFGEPGDSAEDVKTRRGGVVYIIPEAHFMISANFSRSDKNPDNYIGIGQKVWINRSKDYGVIAGTGTVVSMEDYGDSDGKYMLEINSGEFVLTEKVGIFRDETLDWSVGLGFGSVTMAPDVAVSGDGSILRMHVKPGDKVERGDLLFETVSGQLEELKAQENTVLSTVTGIVKTVDTADGASVEQGGALMTVYPLDRLQVCATVPETDLAQLVPGSPVRLQFGSSLVQEGRVASVSYLAETEESASASAGYAQYRVYFDFDNKENVRQGMFVTIEISPAEEPAEEPAREN